MITDHWNKEWYKIIKTIMNLNILFKQLIENKKPFDVSIIEFSKYLVSPLHIIKVHPKFKKELNKSSKIIFEVGVFYDIRFAIGSRFRLPFDPHYIYDFGVEPKEPKIVTISIAVRDIKKNQNES